MAGNLSATDLALTKIPLMPVLLRAKIAKSTIINVAGIDGITGTGDDQIIGVVGATTPTFGKYIFKW